MAGDVFISTFDLALSISFRMGFCLLCQLTIVSATLLCFPDELTLTHKKKKRKKKKIYPLACVKVCKPELLTCHGGKECDRSRAKGGRGL